MSDSNNNGAQEEILAALSILIKRSLSKSLDKRYSEQKDSIDSFLKDLSSNIEEKFNSTAVEIAESLAEGSSRRIDQSINNIDWDTIVPKEYLQERILDTAVSMLPTEDDLMGIVQQVYDNNYGRVVESYQTEINNFISSGISEMESILLEPTSDE